MSLTSMRLPGLWGATKFGWPPAPDPPEDGPQGWVAMRGARDRFHETIAELAGLLPALGTKPKWTGGRHRHRLDVNRGDVSVLQVTWSSRPRLTLRTTRSWRSTSANVHRSEQSRARYCVPLSGRAFLHFVRAAWVQLKSMFTHTIHLDYAWLSGVPTVAIWKPGPVRCTRHSWQLGHLH